MARMPDTISVRLDVSDMTDVLGTLSQAFQDCADALLMARDKLDEAHTRTEQEDVPDEATAVELERLQILKQALGADVMRRSCTCGNSLSPDRGHHPACALSGRSD